MKGGRLKIVNESRYPDDEVEALVRFGLQDLDIKGQKLLAVVVNNPKHAYRGYAGTASMYGRERHRLAVKLKARYVIQINLGAPSKFPIWPFTRHGIRWDIQTWQEALVKVTAHEGRHIQHRYDGAYRGRSGVRLDHYYGDSISVRVGHERVEPKCDAHALLILRRFRESQPSLSPCGADGVRL